MSVSLNDRCDGKAAVASPQIMVSGERLSGPLERLVKALLAYGRPLAMEELVCMLRNAPLTLTDVQPFIRFNDDGYCRQTVYVCDEFEVCCLSWRCGQYSTAHDHGHCRCCVRVMQGTLTNTELDGGPEGPLFVVQRSNHLAGELVATEPYSIHQAGNAQKQELVTLHVYSPRLPTAGE